MNAFAMSLRPAAIAVLSLASASCVMLDKRNTPEMPDEVAAARETTDSLPGVGDVVVAPGQLPDLEPDWTPLWWDEELALSFAPMSLIDLMPLLTRRHPVTFTPDVLAEWAVTPGDDLIPAEIDLGDAADGEGRKHTVIPGLPPHLATRGEAIEYLCHLFDYGCEVGPGGALAVSVNIVRWYYLTAQPGELQGSMGTEGLGASSGQSSSSMNNAPYASTIEPAIAMIMEQDAARGGSVSLSPEANTLIVVARPSIQRQIMEVVDMLNNRFALTARVQVSIFEIDRTSEVNFGLTPLLGDSGDFRDFIGADFEDGRYKHIFHGIQRQALQNSMISYAYNAGGGVSSFRIAASALATISAARVVFNETLETRNNVIITSQNLISNTFITGVTRNIERFQDGGGSNDRTEVTTEELQTGWSVSVMPTIAPNGLITVRLGIARSDLAGTPRSVEFDGNEITLLDTEQLNRQMSITLKDGQSHLASMLSSQTEGSGAGLWNKSRRKITKEFAVLITAESVDLY